MNIWTKFTLEKVKKKNRKFRTALNRLQNFQYLYSNWHQMLDANKMIPDLVEVAILGLKPVTYLVFFKFTDNFHFAQYSNDSFVNL